MRAVTHALPRKPSSILSDVISMYTGHTFDFCEPRHGLICLFKLGLDDNYQCPIHTRPSGAPGVWLPNMSNIADRRYKFFFLSFSSHTFYSLSHSLFPPPPLKARLLEILARTTFPHLQITLQNAEPCHFERFIPPVAGSAYVQQSESRSGRSFARQIQV